MSLINIVLNLASCRVETSRLYYQTVSRKSALPRLHSIYVQMTKYFFLMLAAVTDVLIKKNWILTQSVSFLLHNTAS